MDILFTYYKTSISPFLEHSLPYLLLIFIFVIAWNARKKNRGYSEAKEMTKCESPIEVRLFKALRRKNYQVYTQVACNNYRIDLVIYTGKKKLAIEADGKNYHSSVQQVKHDKEKDWQLRKHGWEVIRFTGSEIYRNSNQCVEEIEKLLPGENSDNR